MTTDKLLIKPRRVGRVGAGNPRNRSNEGHAPQSGQYSRESPRAAGTSLAQQPSRAIVDTHSVLVGPVITRRADTELEVRSRREELMLNLRWAAELAVEPTETRARLGLSELHALAESDLLDASQQIFIDAALAAIVEKPVEQIVQAGADAEVLQVLAREHVGVPDAASAALSSEPNDEGRQ